MFAKSRKFLVGIFLGIFLFSVVFRFFVPFSNKYIFAGTLPPETQNRDIWIVNGEVNASAISGSTVYLGGTFSDVCSYTGAGVPVDSSGNAVTTYPYFQHTDDYSYPYVEVSVSDGSGGWYVGGEFSRVGTETRNHIAHVKADGTVDATWNPNADDAVLALAVSGNTLYVGGYFHTIGGQSRNHIAALDISGGSTGTASSWNPNSNNVVYTLFVDGSYVYAGGTFTTVNSSSFSKIARINTSTGVPDAAWTPNATGTGATVYSIYVLDSVIYAGGLFTTIGGASRSRMAALNNTNGQAVPTWDANVTGTSSSSVRSVVASGSSVYIGGYFSAVSSHSLSNIAKLDLTTGHADDTWTPNANGGVKALSLNGTTLYVGGVFTTIGGAARLRVGAVNIGDGTVTSWSPNASFLVYTVTNDGTNTFIGMEGNGLKCKLRSGLAAIDLTTGEPTNWDPASDANDIYALTVSGGKIYVGGMFWNIGGQVRNNLAVLDLTNGTADATWNPDPSGVVRAIKVSGSTVYVGGDFTTIGGASKSYLAALNDTNGNANGSWTADANGSVYALALGSDRLYVGGDFTTVNSTSKISTAAVSLTDGSLISGWSADTNAGTSLVYALTVEGSSLYIGGNFTSINATLVDYLAKISTTDGTLDSAWLPDPNSYVYALLYNDGNLYIGGRFSTINGGANANQYLAAVDPTGTGTALSWQPNPDWQVESLLLSGSNVIAGGDWMNLHAEGLYGNAGTNSWSYFAMFGTYSSTPPTSTPTPTATSTPAPTATPTPGSTTTVCNDQKPSFAPNLFQIDRNGTSATLYFAPAGDPITGYHISWGITSNAEGQGKSLNMNQCSSAISYTINNLIANLTYYFKVKGINGCTSGDWSNIRESKVLAAGCVDCSVMPGVTVTPTPIPEDLTPTPTKTQIEIPEIVLSEMPSMEPIIEIVKRVLGEVSSVAVGTVMVISAGTILVSSLAIGQTVLQTIPLNTSSVNLWRELLGTLFLPLFGFLRKKQKTLGIVLDAVTNQPVVGAYVVLYSSSGNLKTSFTNKNGRFSFSHLKPDTYKIKVDHNQYKFLSTLITVNENNQFTKIYQGEDLVITQQIPFSNLAVFGDPAKVSLSFIRKLAIKLKSSWGWFFVRNFYFFCLLFLSVCFISYIINPTFNNFVLSAAVLFTFIYNALADLASKRNYGKVVDKNNKPLKDMILELYKNSELYASTSSDEGGKFLFTPEEGTYLLKLVNPDYHFEKQIEVKEDSSWIKEKIVLN